MVLLAVLVVAAGVTGQLAVLVAAALEILRLLPHHKVALVERVQKALAGMVGQAVAEVEQVL